MNNRDITAINNSKEKTAAKKQLPPVKSVKQDKKTGELVIKYANGVEKRYSKDDPNRSLAEESLRYQNYSTNFDFKA